MTHTSIPGNGKQYNHDAFVKDACHLQILSLPVKLKETFESQIISDMRIKRSK